MNVSTYIGHVGDSAAALAAWMGIPQAAIIVAQASIGGGLDPDAQIILALGITASMVIAAIKGRQLKNDDDDDS